MFHNRIEKLTKHMIYIINIIKYLEECSFALLAEQALQTDALHNSDESRSKLGGFGRSAELLAPEIKPFWLNWRIPLSS